MDLQTEIPEAGEPQVSARLSSWIVAPEPGVHLDLFVRMLEIYLDWAKTVPEINGTAKAEGE